MFARKSYGALRQSALMETVTASHPGVNSKRGWAAGTALASSLALAAAVVPGAAAAGNIVWTGKSSNDWYSGTNWFAGTAPTASDDVYIDLSSPNAARISSGTANAASIRIATTSSANSSLTVDGSGTALIESVGGIVVGDRGNAALNITNGAIASFSGLLTDLNSTAQSQIYIDGAGSALYVWKGNFLTSGKAYSTLTVQNGGSLLVGGNFDLSETTATFDGAGTSVLVSYSTIRGSSQALLPDNVTVRNGATFQTKTLDVANGPGFGASLTIDGAGSILKVTTSAIIGDTNLGALILTNGGAANFTGGPGSLIIANASGSGGSSISIGQGGGAPGVLNAADVTFGAGSGILSFDHNSTNYVFTPRLVGAGSILVNNGVTVLTADSSAFTGGTGVMGGTLVVNGKLGGAVGVSPGGALGGGGELLGSVSVLSSAFGSGILNGVHGQTLTIDGSLNLSHGSQLNVTLDAPDNGATALFSVGQKLILDGVLNIASSSGFSPGLYRLFNYGGSLTDNGLAIGSTPGGTTASAFTLQKSIAGQVNLVYGAPTPTLNFWNGSSGVATGVIQGGSGTWTAVSNSFTDAAATTVGPLSPKAAIAIFAGKPGAVTVDDSQGAVSAPALQFAVDGYKIQGGPLTLTGASAEIRVGDGTAAGAGYTATIAAPLAGASGVIKTDLGALVLSGTNTYTGGTTISAGVLQLGTGGTTGSITGDVVDNGTLTFDRSDTLTFSGNISGSGKLVQAGSGATVLIGDNAVSGQTVVSSGLLEIGDAAHRAPCSTAMSAACSWDQPARSPATGPSWAPSPTPAAGPSRPAGPSEH